MKTLWSCCPIPERPLHWNFNHPEPGVEEALIAVGEERYLVRYPDPQSPRRRHHPNGYCAWCGKDAPVVLP